MASTGDSRSLTPKIAVFCSGNGSNFETLVKANRKGVFPGEISLMVADKKQIFAIKRAEKLKIPVLYVNPKAFNSEKDYEKVLIKELKTWRIEWILLAGFMRILSPFFVSKFKNRIVNIHPSLLPAFKGAHAIADAYNYGVVVTGVTIHLVDNGVDSGPIVLQEALKIKPEWSLEQLEEAIHKVEHKLYPKAVNLLLTKRWRILKNRKFIICS